MTLKQLKAKHGNALPNVVQDRWEVTEPLRRSRNRWRAIAAIFFFLFILESCLPEPDHNTTSMEHNV